MNTPHVVKIEAISPNVSEKIIRPSTTLCHSVSAFTDVGNDSQGLSPPSSPLPPPLSALLSPFLSPPLYFYSLLLSPTRLSTSISPNLSMGFPTTIAR